MRQSSELDNLLALPVNRGLGVDIAARLRAALLNGAFDPGEQLREEALAKSMGVSRGPVREALVQLEREGLILIRRNRGAFVAQLSTSDLDEVYTLRVAIEQLAVARTVEHATDSQIAEMQAVVDDMVDRTARGISEKEAAELDLHFHELIYRAAAHRRLLDCWTNLRPQIHVILLNRNVAHGDFREMVGHSHQIIVDAIRERNAALAVELTIDHLHGSYERVLQGYEARATEPETT
jgi:DNA-binding GntR family transcriptional regulator